MILLNHSQLDWPTKMSTMNREMIKQAIIEMVNKAIDNRAGGMENSEVCYLNFRVVMCLLISVNCVKGFVPPVELSVVDRVVDPPQEGKVGII